MEQQHIPFVAPQKKPESQRKLFDLERKDMIFAVIMCAAAIAFSIFGLWGGFRGGFFAVALLIFAAITGYLYNRQVKLRAYPLFCGILACLLMAVFLITSNGSIRFWSFLAIGLTQCVWFASLANQKTADGDLGLFGSVVNWLIRGMCRRMLDALISLFASKNTGKKGVGRAMLGIALAMPVLMIVVPLLIASDVAFSGMAEKLTENIALTVFQAMVGMMVVPFMISYGFFMKKGEPLQDRQSKFKGFDRAIIISFLAALSVCYLAYLFSQLAYFFSAFEGFLPEGYTFQVSEYARRGFFEMAAIAGINFLIIYAALLLSKKKEGKVDITTRILCLFISLFTLIIIATAISKMYLYIRSFGMTTLRITTSAFMVFLAVVFLSLILRLFRPKVKVLQVALATAGVVLVVLGCANVNRVVAAYNYNAYKTGTLDTIDLDNIYQLGDEGVYYLAELTQDSNPEIAKDADNLIWRQIVREYYSVSYEADRYVVYERRYADIGEYSIARGEAYQVLDDYIASHPERFIKGN